MRKIQLFLAVLAAAAFTAAGCGKSSAPATEAQETPTPEAEAEGELVEMEKTEKPLEAEKAPRLPVWWTGSTAAAAATS